MSDIDDLLDDRMSGSTGDYPPWFDEDGTDQGEPPLTGDEGDTLQGRVTKVRDDPFYDPSEEDEPKPILHVEAPDGDEWSTRTHVTLVQLIREQEPEVGDLVRIQYDGAFKTDNGQMANDYQLGVVRSDELDDVDSESTSEPDESVQETDSEEPSDDLDESDGSDDDNEEPEDDDSSDLSVDPSEQTVSDIEALVSTISDVDTLNQMAAAEMSGKDRKTAKAHIKNRISELEDDGSSEDTSDDTDDESPDVPGDVAEFTESLLSFHGELTLEELDEYLNETRDFDVDPERVAKGMDVEFDGEAVRS